MAMPSRSTRLLALVFFIATAGPSASTTTPVKAGVPAMQKLDAVLKARASRLTGRSRVIIRAAKGTSAQSVSTLIRVAGGSSGRDLPIIGGLEYRLHGPHYGHPTVEPEDPARANDPLYQHVPTTVAAHVGESGGESAPPQPDDSGSDSDFYTCTPGTRWCS